MTSCPGCGQVVAVGHMLCTACQALTASDLDVVSGTAVKPPWYTKTSSLLIAFFVVGPLAIPLIWTNRQLRPMTKWVVTIVMCVATWYILVVLLRSVQSIRAYYQFLES